MPAYPKSPLTPYFEKLPRPIRGLMELGGMGPTDIPMPMGTTIGPKAIPLGNYEDYIRRVVTDVMDEIPEVATKYSKMIRGSAPSHVNKFMQAFSDRPYDISPHVSTLSEMLARDPSVNKAGNKILWRGFAKRGDVEEAVQGLADMFLGLPR